MSHDTIHTFKNYFVTVFSVFSYYHWKLKSSKIIFKCVNIAVRPKLEVIFIERGTCGSREQCTKSTSENANADSNTDTDGNANALLSKPTRSFTNLYSLGYNNHFKITPKRIKKYKILPRRNNHTLRTFFINSFLLDKALETWTI